MTKEVSREELDKHSIEELKEGIVQELLFIVELMEPIWQDEDVSESWAMDIEDELVPKMMDGIWKRVHCLVDKGCGYKGKKEVNLMREEIYRRWAA
jgi:hypothetical protein